MRAFQPAGEMRVCEFEDEEVELLTSLLAQLIELLSDAQAGYQGSRAGHLPDAGDDVFARLASEMSGAKSRLCDSCKVDPIIERLFPSAYPDDPISDDEFRRYSAPAQCDDKIIAAKCVLADLEACSDGTCEVHLEHVGAWLKSLTSLRLALAVRLDIHDAADNDALEELGDDSPQRWIFAIYEWLGWVQESLLVVLD